MPQYPDYPDKAWDEDAIKEARKHFDRPRIAMAIAGTVRHPDRRKRLQDHIDTLIPDPRPEFVQFVQDVLKEPVVWPPEPYVHQPKARPKAKPKRKNGAG